MREFAPVTRHYRAGTGRHQRLFRGLEKRMYTILSAWMLAADPGILGLFHHVSTLTTIWRTLRIAYLTDANVHVTFPAEIARHFYVCTGVSFHGQIAVSHVSEALIDSFIVYSFRFLKSAQKTCKQLDLPFPSNAHASRLAQELRRRAKHVRRRVSGA